MQAKKNFFLILLLSSILLSSCNDDEIISPDTTNVTSDTTKITLNIMDFGADNTGTVDCSSAFQKLLLSMGNKTNIDIYLPAGKYKISKRITFDQTNFSGYTVNHGLSIRGAGEDVTEIFCDNKQGVFYFNVNTNLITVTVQDMSLVAVQENSGTALEFNTNNTNPGDHHSRMFQAKNLLIRGISFDKGYFASGVLCYNAWYPAIDNVKISSRYGTGSDLIKMNYGFLFQDCYSPIVTNSYFWGNASYGLLYKKANISSEDGIVDNCYFVGQENGIYIDIASYSDWPEPAFHVTNCHINYLKNGLFLKGMRQIFVSNNLFYCHNTNGSLYLKDTNPVSSYESRDINCDYTSDVIISNNQFTEPASPLRIAIDISDKSSNILIDSNIFNFDGTAIRNNSAKTSRSANNVFAGEPSFTVGLIRYKDNTGTLITNDFEKVNKQS